MWIITKSKSSNKVIARETYENNCKEEKEKNNNMVMNVIKISQKMKNQSLLNIEKNTIE